MTRPRPTIEPGDTALLGLLAKAHQLRDRLHKEGRLREEIAFDPQSGISREDQREIMKEIETVATGSRMEVSPEAFIIHAVKRGSLFPIAAGVITTIVGAAALAILYFLFQTGETRISTQQTVGITAEGQLIAAMKKEADAKLAEKSQEIDQIQGRLQEIDKQRQDLQNTMDQKVGEREKALRDAMAKELEEEREKLKGQGLSEETINQRIQALETQKNAQFTQQLDAFKKQAEQDKQKSEESLRALESQYNANLAAANTEKQQALAESQKREAELKSQLEQQAKALETAKTKAEQDLQAINAQRAKEDLASNQLIGLYEVAKADIARQDYAKALVSLKAVGDFVARSDVSTLPVMAERRDFDLFVVDALTKLVQTERNQSQIDTAALMAASSQIASIKVLVSDAEALAASGRTVEAEKTYSQALQVLPDIQKSFTYLSRRQGDALNGVQEKVRDAVSRAEAAFTSGRQTEAMTAYREALSYLPETSERLDRAVQNIQTTGFQEASQRTRQEQSRSAAPLLARADESASSASPQDSLAMYVEILTTYPLSSQAPQVVVGINAQVQRLLALSAKSQSTVQKALSDQIASLQKDLAARQAEVAALSKDSASRQAENTQLQRDLAARMMDNVQLQKDAATRLAEITTLQKDLAARQAEIDGLEKDAAARQAELSALQKNGAVGQTELAAFQRDAAARQAEIDQLKRDAAAGQAESDQLKKDLAASQAESILAQKDLAARQADVSRFKREIAALISQPGDPEKMDSGTLLEALKTRYAGLEKTGSAAGTQADAELLRKSEEEKAKLLGQIDSLKKELVKAQAAAQAPGLSQADSQLLAKLKDRFAGLDSSYRGYTSLEDPLIASRGLDGLVETKGYLDSFLSSKAVDETFPGLLARIKRYDQGFWSAGRAEALDDVLDIVIALSSSTTSQDSKKRLIQEKLSAYRDDKDMTQILIQFQQMLK